MKTYANLGENVLASISVALALFRACNQLEFIHEPCLLGEWEKDVYVAELDSRAQKC